MEMSKKLAVRAKK